MTDPSLPSHSASRYPRSYLLSIYTAAIEQGFIWIGPVRAADANSLRASLLRLRRRSDTANKGLITPEHHLVTFGPSEPLPEPDLVRFAAMFSASPYGLPAISSADGVPLEATASPPTLQEPAGAVPLPASLDNLDTGSIDDFVTQMMKDAAKRGEQP